MWAFLAPPAGTSMSIAPVVSWGTGLVVPSSHLTVRHTTSEAGTSLMPVVSSVTAVAHPWRRVPGAGGLALKRSSERRPGQGHENDRVFPREQE